MSENPYKQFAAQNPVQNKFVPPKPAGTGGWKPPNQANPANTQNNSAIQPPAQTQPPVNQTTPPPVVSQPPTTGFKPPGSNPPAAGGWKPGGAQNPPGFFKPPGTTAPVTAGNNSWMKNKQGASPIATDRKQQQQKAQQEKQRKLKQQEQNKKKEQEQKLRLKQQQQKTKQQQAKKKKTAKGSKKSSPTKQSKQPRNFSSLFHKYLLTISSSLLKSEDYANKIENQKQLVQCFYKFSQSCTQGLERYLSQRKINQRKKNVINLQNIFIQYALVEGVSGDIANAYFKTKSIQTLEQKFKHYQVLFHLVGKLIKKSSSFRLRAPLLSRVSYKGIQFLCEGVCDELLDSISIPAQNILQVQAQLTQLQKQLNQAGYQYINRKTIQLKKVSMQSEQYFVIYLVEDYGLSLRSIQSHTQILFSPYIPRTCDSLTNLSLLASRTLNITYGLMRQFPKLKISSSQLLNQTYLNQFQIAHAIRVVYASCQGEVDQQSFWKLVFDNNQDMWTLIKKAYQSIFGQVKDPSQLSLRNKFILSKIIQQNVSVVFGIGHQHNSSYKFPVYLRNKSIVYCYPLQTIQIYEISQLLNKTIDNPSKIKISQDSLHHQQSILGISNQLYVKKALVFANKLNLMLQRAICNQQKQLLKKAIDQAQLYEFNIEKGRQMQKIIIQPILISLYMAATQLSITITIDKHNEENKQKQNNDKQGEQKHQSKQDNQQINLQQSQVRQIKSYDDIKRSAQKSQSQKNDKKQSKEQSKLSPTKKRVKYTNYQQGMLKCFYSLLQYIQMLFQDQKQVWIHSGLYMILASYYSKIGSIKQKQNNTQKQEQNTISLQFQQSSKKNINYFSQKSLKLSKTKQNENNLTNKQQNRQGHQQQQTQLQHPYKKQCFKLLELGHNACLNFYGARSLQMADFLMNQSQIYYKMREYQKSQNSIQQAMKIFKSSSKHNKNVLNSTIIYGKSLFQQGKSQKDIKILQKSIQILQKTVQELACVSMDKQIMQTYEFLCANMKYNKEQKNKSKTKSDFQKFNNYTKIQAYLQKMAELSFRTKNVDFLKKVLRKIVQSQINVYSKQTAITLKQLYTQYAKDRALQQQTERQKYNRHEQIMSVLEQQKINFGGLVQIIKWSLGMIKIKNQSVQLQRATQVIETVFGLFTQKQILQMLSL